MNKAFDVSNSRYKNKTLSSHCCIRLHV